MVVSPDPWYTVETDTLENRRILTLTQVYFFYGSKDQVEGSGVPSLYLNNTFIGTPDIAGQSQRLVLPPNFFKLLR